MISSYSLENLYLNRANICKFFPLIPYYDHGWDLNDKLSKSIIQNPSRYHFCWSQRQKQKYLKIDKKFFITGSPFIFFKEDQNIKKTNEKNTIFFFSHSTTKINQIINLQKLIDALNDVPESLKPIDICLHYNDLKKYKTFFESFGFKVVSAGSQFNDKFVDNFYNILKKYSYTCSNILGTYVLYSIDLKIPFFLVGPEPIYDNYKLDKNVPRSFQLSKFNTAKKIYKLFEKRQFKISLDQELMCKEELGLSHRIDRFILKKVILEAFKEAFYDIRGMKSLARAISRNLLFKYKSVFF